MRTFMRIPRRYLLLLVVATILLISGIGIAASRRAVRTTTPPDCAGDCRERRDKMLERCNGLPETARDRCKDNASKQYDKCIERCNSGMSPGGN